MSCHLRLDYYLKPKNIKREGLYISFAYVKLSFSFKNPVPAVNIEAECCLDPKNKKQVYNVARHTGDQ